VAPAALRFDFVVEKPVVGEQCAKSGERCTRLGFWKLSNDGADSLMYDPFAGVQTAGCLNLTRKDNITKNRPGNGLGEDSPKDTWINTCEFNAECASARCVCNADLNGDGKMNDIPLTRTFVVELNTFDALVETEIRRNPITGSLEFEEEQKKLKRSDKPGSCETPVHYFLDSWIKEENGLDEGMRKKNLKVLISDARKAMKNVGGVCSLKVDCRMEPSCCGGTNLKDTMQCTGGKCQLPKPSKRTTQRAGGFPLQQQQQPQGGGAPPGGGGNRGGGAGNGGGNNNGGVGGRTGGTGGTNGTTGGSSRRSSASSVRSSSVSSRSSSSSSKSKTYECPVDSCNTNNDSVPGADGVKFCADQDVELGTTTQCTSLQSFPCLECRPRTSSSSRSSSSSSRNLCGNKTFDEGEECGEPGLSCSFGGACDTKSCQCTLCGDSKIEGDEQCDDGNNVDGDGCSLKCKVETCGDKIVQKPGEQCDNGSLCNANASLSCVLDAECRVCKAVNGGAKRCAGSGFGKLCNADADCATETQLTCEYKEDTKCTNDCKTNSSESSKASSSRNSSSKSSSDRSSRTSSVRVSSVRPSSERFTSARSSRNSSDQSTGNPLCGNNKLDAGETCDGSGVRCDFGASCKDCVCQLCGNSIREGEESCDDGNNLSNDGCSDKCQVEKCGDKVTQQGEQCDNGSICSQNPSLRCVVDAQCRMCGAVVGGAKRCGAWGGGTLCNVDVDCANEAYTCQYDQSSNTSCVNCIRSGSAGSSASGNPLCGNGKADPGEVCDGNALKCSFGASCNNCVCQLCGNSVREGDESCDDGNNANNDGCSAICQVEKCGDKIIQPIEQCDNGSTCTQNTSLQCVTDAQCRTCLAVTGGAKRCGGSTTGILCNVDVDCAAQTQLTCGYDTTNARCNVSCLSTTPTASSRSSTPTTLGCTTDAQCGTCRRCSNSQCVDIANCNGTTSSRASVPATRACFNNFDCGNCEQCSSNRCVSIPNCNAGTNGTISTISGVNFTVSGTTGTIGGTNGGTTPSICGDGVRDRGEICDDGNQIDNDECTNNCRRPPESECTSAAQCESRICRTGRCAPCAINEECPADHRCVAGNCIIAPPFCGNGQLEPGEQCDDGNINDRDVCSNDCLLGTSQRCSYDFQCDTGRCVNGVCSRCASDDQCPNDLVCVDGECLKVRDVAFTPNFCGNAILEPDEACDLGTENSDKPNAACRPDCSRGRCGDSVLDRPLEVCDDGNTTPGDGCNSLCQVEPGGMPGVIRPDQLAQIPFQPGGGAQSGGGTQQQGGGGAVGGDIIRPRPPTGGQVSGDSGPATVAVMAAGAAAGTAWVRRRFGKRK